MSGANMAKMRAVQVSYPKGALELVEREIPEPNPATVRIFMTPSRGGDACPGAARWDVCQSASQDPSPDPEMCPDHWLSSLLLLLDHVLRLLVALHHGAVVGRHEAIQLGELGCFRTVPRAVRLG
jgi:hypothetical protein